MTNFATADTLIWSTNANAQAQQQNQAVIPTPAQLAAATGTLGPFDVHGFRQLWLEVLLASFTGGTTPSFQPELDALDDDSPANAIALWKPTAATTATKWLEIMGVGQGTAPTPAGWTVGVVATDFGPYVQFAWTVAGAPTAVAAKIFLYGKR